MSKSLLRSFMMMSALAGFMAAPALSADVEAQPDNSLLNSGYIGISAGIEDASFPSRDEFDVHFIGSTEFTAAAHGYWSIPLGEAISIQFDGQGELYDRETDDEEDPKSAYQFGGHLSWRDPTTELLGIFGGA